jgi:rhodanese-related sulfurtransferase
MTHFLDFLVEQWMLVSALLVMVALFLWTEGKRAGVNISVHQLTALVNNQNALVVDLREPKEFREGHIIDAINVPFAKIADRLSELEAHKSRTFILVDKMGQHSAGTGRTLKQAGFQVARLNGGMSEWIASKLPLVKN